LAVLGQPIFYEEKWLAKISSLQRKVAGQDQFLNNGCPLKLNEATHNLGLNVDSHNLKGGCPCLDK
jgi:hypothetical protein